MTRLGVLISGRGSNMLALQRAIDAGSLNATISHVLSSKPDTLGAAAARTFCDRVSTLNAQDFADRDAFDRALDQLIPVGSVDFLVLAGFMRILTAQFIAPRLGTIVNIHPSLLPKFPGLHPHRRALANGETEHGASVHFVIPELDLGPVFAQARLTIEPTDSESSLADRVLALEHELYPRAVQLLVKRRIVWSADALLLDGRPLTQPLELAALLAGD